MTREEFIADLKERALDLARIGELHGAVATVTGEINSRPGEHELKLHHATVLAGIQRAIDDDKPGVIAWIEGVR